MSKPLEVILVLLWRFSGDDYRIIADCKWRNRLLFASIGAIVFSILVLTMISVQVGLESLFKSAFIGITIGLFFSGVLFILYLLLLYTLTRNLLPSNDPKTTIVSRMLRYGFIIFLAVIVSKPLEFTIMSDSTASLVKEIKAEQLVSLESSILDVENSRIAYIREQLSRSTTSLELIHYYKELEEEVKRETAINTLKARQLVDESLYFIKALRRLHEREPRIWWITAAIAFIFLLPIIIKNALSRKDNEYLLTKQLVERETIENHYQFTKEMYTNIFWTNHKRFAKIVEMYDDAPYNLKRKQKESEPLKQEDLVELIYKK